MFAVVYNQRGPVVAVRLAAIIVMSRSAVWGHPQLRCAVG